MSRFYLYIVFLAFTLSSCQTEKKSESEEQQYLRWVGDIAEQRELDEADFELCHGEDQALQYFNLGQGPVYSEEKSGLLKMYTSEYQPVKDSDESGLIRIRFIVNCEGKAGRFRMLQSDYNYNEKVFDPHITDQLLNLTKGIEHWEVLYRDEVPVDYYIYLIFKIDDGELTEILP